jgi:hypothetical protein
MAASGTCCAATSADMVALAGTVAVALAVVGTTDLCNGMDNMFVMLLLALPLDMLQCSAFGLQSAAVLLPDAVVGEQQS